MAILREKVHGFEDLERDLKAIARIVPGGDLADALYDGAKEIKAWVQQFILFQGLYDEGALYHDVRLVKVNQYRVDIVVGSKKVPHAAIHEYGGTFAITERQRRFFWAQFAGTGDEMWKALALSTTYTMPAKPYFRRAVDSSSTRQMAVRRTARMLERKIREAVK